MAEDAVDGYETTISGYDITNTHTPKPDEPEPPVETEKISMSGRKIWDDQSNQDGIRPGVITINLLRNGDRISSRKVREADGWSWTFDNLDKTDAAGNEYVYSFTEEPVTGYETQVEGNIIINKHTPEGQDYESMMYVQGEIF